MTREETTEVKRIDDFQSQAIAASGSDRARRDEPTVFDNPADSASDSERRAVDRNNNLSPPPFRSFTAHSCATRGQLSRSGCGSSSGVRTGMSSENLSHGSKGVISTASHGIDERECSLGEYEEDFFAPTPESTSDDDDVFTNDDLDSKDDACPRLEHANANENNNSNRKKFRGLGSNVASNDLQNNNNNSWNFRAKMRSVQLSSVRARKGRYQGSEIKPYKGRMISRNGASNVRLKKFGRLDWMSRYSKDIYTTLIDLSWTWIIFLTSAVYIGHWIIFGIIFWIFAIANDDYAKMFPPESGFQAENATGTGSRVANVFPGDMCVSGVYDFASAFLFSMESETTIGYGYRNMGTQCKGAIACLVIQCVLSAIFDTWVIGMCYSRIARPDARCHTILYSKHAVMCTRDGKKCLIVRVANLRKSLLLRVSCRARVITLRAPQRKEVKEGHQFILEQKELSFENANCTMLTAPTEYRHVVDKSSPLFSIPERCFASETQNWFEIAIILTGIVEATGMTMHAQTSYLSTEIKFNHRFQPIVAVSPTKEKYTVDFSKFHNTVKEPSNVLRMAAASRRRESRPSRFEALIEESEEADSDDMLDRSKIGQHVQCQCCEKHQYRGGDLECPCHGRVNVVNLGVSRKDFNRNSLPLQQL